MSATVTCTEHGDSVHDLGSCYFADLCIFYTSLIQATLTGTADLGLDHHNEVNIAIKQVT